MFDICYYILIFNKVFLNFKFIPTITIISKLKLLSKFRLNNSCIMPDYLSSNFVNKIYLYK